MASIRDSERAGLELILLNLASKKGMGITPMLSGPHGIGKTQIVYQIGKRLNAHVAVIEGSVIKEGEVPGLPMAFKNDDGSSEVRFVPYYVISNIMKLEKEYLNIAKTTGFLDGSVKINGDVLEVKENGQTKKSPLRSKIENIINGESNAFKWGEDLSLEMKLKLLESGEIRPVIILIDELNRAEMQTMKELMNFILNRSINGYDLPWWVSIISAVNPSSQNSTYATNEMDDAQRDRFVKLVVNARLDDWVDYALSAGVDGDVISAIAVSEDIFMYKEKGYDDTDEQKPSPRSWEMVGTFYRYLRDILGSKFFTNEDRKHYEEDLRMLINAKVGPTAGRTFWHNINNLADLVRPEEIINGTSDKIADKVLEKLKNQRAISKKITAHNVIDYLAKTICTFEKKKATGKPDEKKEYINFKEQLKHFVVILDDSTRLLFVKKISDLEKVVATDGKNLFFKISNCFSKETLEQLTDMEINIQNLNKE